MTDPRTTPEYPTHAPAKKRSKAKTPIIAGVTGALALFAGVGIGVGNDGTATAEPAPTVTATETTTAEPEVRTETVTEEVEVTPEACLDYITLSEQAFTISGEAMGYAGAALDAAINLDVTAMEAAAGGLEQSNADIDEVSGPLLAAKEQCRGAGA